jgi:D-inositol-3-phosphate glycosyltransferase
MELMTADRTTGNGDRPRAALISLHTSPRDQPGSGDSGGMNVYVLEVAKRLAEQGIAVDVFTRCRGQGGPEVDEFALGSRLIRVQAGPCAPVPKDELPRVLPIFLRGVLERASSEHRAHHHSPYDVVHSHYWLSGWVGRWAKQIWGAPLVASFHTLGRVKNSALAEGDRPEPDRRLDGERSVVRGADRILAPTPAEAAHLVGLYGADPKRIRIVPPGVDQELFAPRSKEEAKARLHLTNARLVLFVGRIQPLKGADVAIRAMAEAIRLAPDVMADALQVVVGGSAGHSPEIDEVARLMELATALGIGERVIFFPPQPHSRLADFYSAAEVVLVPSRSESFGLVALEAQSCGTPVLGARVGGLRYSVKDGVSGLLVEGHDPAAYAERIVAVLSQPHLAERLSLGALEHARRFTWDTTAGGIRDVYLELIGRRGWD